MENKILKRVDEAIEIMKPVVEERMPCRKWKMHINLFWDDSFSILFEYTEDLSETDGGKMKNRYELSNQFWYSDSNPDVIEYNLIRFVEDNREVAKKEEIPVSGGSRIAKRTSKKDASSSEKKTEEEQESPPDVTT